MVLFQKKNILFIIWIKLSFFSCIIICQSKEYICPEQVLNNLELIQKYNHFRKVNEDEYNIAKIVQFAAKAIKKNNTYECISPDKILNASVSIIGNETLYSIKFTTFKKCFGYKGFQHEYYRKSDNHDCCAIIYKNIDNVVFPMQLMKYECSSNISGKKKTSFNKSFFVDDIKKRIKRQDDPPKCTGVLSGILYNIAPVISIIINTVLDSAVLKNTMDTLIKFCGVAPNMYLKAGIAILESVYQFVVLFFGKPNK